MAISSLVSYKNYVTNGAALEQKFEKTSDAQREVDYFTKALDKVRTVEDLFKDTRLVAFIATATNLSGEEQYPGKMRRVLSESVSNTDAVMYRLSDNRYAQAADTLRFGDSGLDRLKLASTQSDLIDAYKKAKFEESIGTENPAVRKARYFEQYAGNVTSAYEILGDPILRDVVTTTLGLPLQIAVQPVETQAQAITDRMDVTKLNDPKFRDTFIKRYLTQYDLTNTDTSTSSDWRLSLFGGSSGSSSNYIVNLFV